MILDNILPILDNHTLFHLLLPILQILMNKKSMKGMKLTPRKYLIEVIFNRQKKGKGNIAVPILDNEKNYTIPMKRLTH